MRPWSFSMNEYGMLFIPCYCVCVCMCLLQLQNQECVRAQIKHAQQEISARLAEVLRRQEDPAQRQRALVEEERHRYLHMEEKLLTQLGYLNCKYMILRIVKEISGNGYKSALVTE